MNESLGNARYLEKGKYVGTLKSGYIVPFLVCINQYCILLLLSVFSITVLYPLYVHFLNWIHKLGRSKILIPLFLAGFCRHITQFVPITTCSSFPGYGHFVLQRCYRETQLLTDWLFPTLSPCTYHRPCIVNGICKCQTFLFPFSLVFSVTTTEMLEQRCVPVSKWYSSRKSYIMGIKVGC